MIFRAAGEIGNSRISLLVYMVVATTISDSSLIERGRLSQMSDKKTWFITGAGRGMGVDFAKAALAAGHNVVATGRNPDTVTKAVGEADDLLVVKLDITSRQDVEAAVKAAVDRFGGIDVLVNNAGSFYAGNRTR